MYFDVHLDIRVVCTSLTSSFEFPVISWLEDFFTMDCKMFVISQFFVFRYTILFWANDMIDMSSPFHESVFYDYFSYFFLFLNVRVETCRRRICRSVSWRNCRIWFFFPIFDFSCIFKHNTIINTFERFHQSQVRSWYDVRRYSDFVQRRKSSSRSCFFSLDPGIEKNWQRKIDRNTHIYVRPKNRKYWTISRTRFLNQCDLKTVSYSSG